VTTVLGGTVAAGTTNNQIVVTGGGLAVNAHRGRFLQIDTARRLIARNDATTGTFAIAEMLKAAAYADYDGSYIWRLS
jgi:hypothetical protein